MYVHTARHVSVSECLRRHVKLSGTYLCEVGGNNIRFDQVDVSYARAHGFEQDLFHYSDMRVFSRNFSFGTGQCNVLS